MLTNPLTEKKTFQEKHILIITDVYREIGGSARAITYLLTHADRKQFQIHVACLTSGRLSQEMQGKGFPIYPLLQGGIYTRNGLQNIRLLRKIIKENSIALIMTYHEAADFYGLLLSKICGVPIITNRRDMGFKTKKHHAIAYRLLGRYFNAVVSVCDAVKNAVTDYRWFPSDGTMPMVTIYNGVDLNEYGHKKGSPLTRESMGISSGSPIIGIVANLRKIKGIAYLIEAGSLLVKHQADLQLVIVGRDLGEKAALLNLVKERNLTKNVHFLQHRLDVVDLISLFDVGILPSLSEGFSNVILEYMAASKPIVATDVGGNKEAIIHGETGLLVPPGDAHALYEAILSLLKDQKKARQLGIAGRKRVEEVFSLEKMVQGYENIFHQFCNK